MNELRQDIRLLAGCFILMSFGGLSLLAQSDSANMIEYTPEFKFREGIFLNHEQVRTNKPVPKSRIITPVDFDDRDFYLKVLENKKLLFYDHIGMKEEVKSDQVWGFSRNGTLYVGLDEKYHRITIVGSICHFVATITTYDTRYNDPYYYNPNDYYYRYGGYPQNTQSSEMRQYILDFYDGKIYEYEVAGLEVLFMRDPELHDEYTALKKKKKRQQKFVYLRKFNQRNPLYIPKY
ncbi:hypothetical protein LCGC14_2451590 [marine sediment metagenome]|uniref:Uncharacterized protein n=1 Tax=marine sediment metagenome TaxID=412755 RepID=A0A0F9BGE5_9ZZZZ|nr:hypothetical protein [Bacteroides sp.]